MQCTIGCMVTCMCMAEILGLVYLCSYARSRREKPETPAKRLATASIANAASAFAFLPATAIGKAPEGLRFGNRERFSSPCPSLPTPPSQPVRTHDAAFPPRRRLALPTPPPAFIPSGQIWRRLSSPLSPPSSPPSGHSACAGLPPDPAASGPSPLASPQRQAAQGPPPDRPSPSTV